MAAAAAADGSTFLPASKTAGASSAPPSLPQSISEAQLAELTEALRRTVERFQAWNLSAALQGQLKMPEPAVSSQVATRAAGAGQVSGLWTWGTPGVTRSPLRNAMRGDGVFPGARVVHEGQIWYLFSYVTVHDPVCFITEVVGLTHPVMDALIVPTQKSKVPELVGASFATTVPRCELAMWVVGHSMWYYQNSIQPYVAPYNEEVSTMGWFANAVYSSQYGSSQESLAAAAGRMGWSLVVRTQSDGDFTHLFQLPSSLRCVLSFTGTQDLLNWFSNLDIRLGSFCGLQGVHQGFANELRRRTQAADWNAKMTPALAACAEVDVVGHSLGGALASLFAACASLAPPTGSPGAEDYLPMSWQPQEPRLLPALA